jgi:hypothetical protein
VDVDYINLAQDCDHGNNIRVTQNATISSPAEILLISQQDLGSMELASYIGYCYPFIKVITKLYHSCNITCIDDGLSSLGDPLIEVFMTTPVI